MHLPLTPRRQEISRLFGGKDYVGLSRLGIQPVDREGGFDCGTFVLHTLGVPSTERTIGVLQSLPRQHTPHEGIVFYCAAGVVRHYGLFENNHVISKWGHGAVLQHALADVPDWYGDSAEFCPITDELRFRLQQAEYFTEE